MQILNNLPISPSSELDECSHTSEMEEMERDIWRGFLNPISTDIASASVKSRTVREIYIYIALFILSTISI